MSGFAVSPIGAPLNEAMAALLAEIHARCFADADGADWSAMALRTILETPAACGWLASAADEPCGMLVARAAGDEGEILTFGVLPTRRRGGCGRSLMGMAARWAGEAGLARLVLEVAVSNDAALEFYRACGFAEVGRRPGYYRAGAERVDALILDAAPELVTRQTGG